MLLYEFLQSDIDIQSQWKVVIFDYDRYERIEVDPTMYNDHRIIYMYAEDDILYIEVEA
jgi:hypothetical protein